MPTANIGCDTVEKRDEGSLYSRPRKVEMTKI